MWLVLLFLGMLIDVVAFVKFCFCWFGLWEVWVKFDLLLVQYITSLLVVFSREFFVSLTVLFRLKLCLHIIDLLKWKFINSLVWKLLILILKTPAKEISRMPLLIIDLLDWQYMSSLEELWILFLFFEKSVKWIFRMSFSIDNFLSGRLFLL